MDGSRSPRRGVLARAAALTLTCVLVVGARGQEEATVEGVADEVLEAAGAGTEVPDAAARGVDPWLVVDALLRRGEGEAAAACAAALPDATRAALAEYVAAAREASYPTDDAGVLDEANAALGERRAEDALALLEPRAGAAEDATDVVNVRILHGLAIALDRVGRVADAAPRYEHAGQAAARLGWTARESAAFYSAGYAWARAGRPDAAAVVLEKALAARERAGDRGAVLQTLWALMQVTRQAGRFEEQLAWGERRLALAREAGDLAVVADALADLTVPLIRLRRDAEALELQREAVDITRELDDPKRLAGALINLGAAIHGLRRHDEARELYREGAELAEGCGAFGYAANAYFNLAMIERFEARHLEAVRWLERAWAMTEELADGEGPDRPAVLSILGDSRMRLGDPEGALAALGTAVEIAREKGARYDLVDALLDLAWAEVDLDRPDAALAHAEEALALEIERGDIARVGRARNVCARVHGALGDRGRQMEQLTAALEAVTAGGHEEWELNIRVNLATALAACGRLEEALAEIETAMELGERQPVGDDVVGTFIHAARIEMQAGRLGHALERAEAAVARARQDGSPYALARAADRAAFMMRRIGLRERAQECYRLSLEAAREGGNRRIEAEALIALGDLLHDSGGGEAALRDIQRGIEIARDAGVGDTARDGWHVLAECLLADGRLEEALAASDEACSAPHASGEASWCQRTRGDVLLALGRPEEALDAFEASARLARHDGLRDGEVEALVGAAWCHLEQGRAAAALGLAEEALVLSGFTQSDLIAEWQARTRRRTGEAADVGIAAAVELGDMAAASRFLEHSRAASLRAALGVPPAADRRDVPEELLAAERDAARAEQRARVALVEAEQSDDRSAVRQRRSGLAAAREELLLALQRVRLASAHRDAADAGDVDPLDEIRGRLRDDDALVCFSRQLEGALALVITVDDARAVRWTESRYQEIRDELWQSMDDTEDALAARVGNLRRLLLAPLAIPESTRRVLVCPESDFAFVSFAMLDPEREHVYVPSGTVHGILTARSALRGEGILALGDPAYPSATDAERGAALRRRPRARLPATGDEARAIGDVVLVGEEATEARLAEALGERERWRAVHLACHGVFDLESPSFSALALASDGADDGYLTVHEIVRSRVPCDLVALSACETAEGKTMWGEGVFGLTSAFLRAGAPRVLSSLWKVDDAATRALMESFYEHWNEKGLRASAALVAAQREVRSQERWRHPRYWAAWVLWGVGD